MVVLPRLAQLLPLVALSAPRALCPPRCCVAPPETDPLGERLYSLLHLGGFAGDLGFYVGQCSEASRVLELGCGDGRVAAALCLGDAPLAVIQELREEEEPSAEDGEGGPAAEASAEVPQGASGIEYMGIETCEAFVHTARNRLQDARAQIVQADFLEPLPEGTAPFDAVVLSANTLFCTPEHAALLERCAAALPSSGLLLLDVYNAIPWHADAEETGDGAKGEGDEGEGGESEGVESEGEGRDLLVQVEDEGGRKWTVFELDPQVDSAAQRITCRYDFEPAAGDPRRESLVHHYALPAQLLELLAASGFGVESIYGDFYGSPFSPNESDHLVVVARRL